MISRGKYVILFIWLPFLLNAQALSSKGRFSVDFDRGCSPMTVDITELDSFGDVTRQYYFFEGAGITNEKSFTYQDPGIYQIVQVVGVDGIDDKTDTLTVEALASIKPDIRLSKCSGNEISILSTDSYYDSIRIHWVSDSSIVIGNNETATYTYPTNDIRSIELEGLFNNADEFCSSFFEEVVPLANISPPKITGASIKESCQNVFTLYLQLNEIDSAIIYRINLSQSGSNIIYEGFPGETNLVFSDISFLREDFCINIEALDQCNNSSTLSSDFCGEVDALSLSPFESLYSSYTSNGVFIQVDSVQSGTFNVYRQLEGEEFEQRASQAGSFVDPLGSTGRKYIYRIDYLDSCNQVLYSAETHPPFVDTEPLETNKYQISFTPAKNNLSGPSNDEYQAGSSSSQTTGELTQTPFTIQLNAKDGSPKQLITATSTYNDQIVLSSNSSIVRHELIIYVPNAFTPNGDGLNDTLELFGLPTETATISIYNRWGQLVYTSDEPSPGWDGTIGGSQAPEGTYLYEIKFETPDGSMKMQKGTFALIKN